MTAPTIAPKPVVLCILDGWGLNPSSEANAVALADTPNFDRIMAECPASTLTAFGPAVGLPEGQMGNSEVGHTNIGAGRVVWMDLPRIDNAIEDGSFFTNQALRGAIGKLHETGGIAHIAGLASPGGVHAHSRHIVAMANYIASKGVKVRLHLFTDGRDVAPKSAYDQVRALEEQLEKGVKVATVSGRFWAMDRDNRWDRVEKAYKAMVEAEGRGAYSAAEAVMGGYDRGETDEFIQPTCLRGHAGMKDGDGLFFVNFRADRAREILMALLDPAFDGFTRDRQVAFATACGMVEYSDKLNTMMSVMFPSEDIVNTLGAWVASKGLRQLRLAETEKYPHVTFFLNGGVETPAEGEDRYMAPSPKVKTYDMAPEMSAAEVTGQLVAGIRSGTYDLIVVNYANPDMVGHTGDLEAAKIACASVDRGLGEALAALSDVGGAMIVTADHGNCDMMVDPETGGAHTAHTLNPVPVVLVGGPEGAALREGGVLGDLAPTLLELMQLPQPAEMTGASLIAK